MIQKDKMEALQYDELMRESAMHQAQRAIVAEGEQGIKSVMYDQCDNYKNYAEFKKAMTRIAHKAYAEYLEDTQEDEQEAVAKQTDENYNQMKWLEEQTM